MRSEAHHSTIPGRAKPRPGDLVQKDVDGRVKPGHDEVVMCIACEMAFMDMLEALAPDERERILREQFGDAAFDAPQAAAPRRHSSASRSHGEPAAANPAAIIRG